MSSWLYSWSWDHPQTPKKESLGFPRGFLHHHHPAATKRSRQTSAHTHTHQMHWLTHSKPLCRKSLRHTHTHAHPWLIRQTLITQTWRGNPASTTQRWRLFGGKAVIHRQSIHPWHNTTAGIKVFANCRKSISVGDGYRIRIEVLQAINPVNKSPQWLPNDGRSILYLSPSHRQLISILMHLESKFDSKVWLW